MLLFFATHVVIISKKLCIIMLDKCSHLYYPTVHYETKQLNTTFAFVKGLL